MARTVQENESPISLFPFLSILACVIGALILMIAALALGQINTPAEDEAIRRAEETLALRKENEGLDAELAAKRAELKDRLARRKAREESERLRERLAVLRKETQQRKKQNETDRARLKKGTEEKAALQSRLDALRLDVKESEALVERARAELARREQVNTEGIVRVRPGGSGQQGRMTPTFVEATAAGLVIHEGEAPVRVGKAEIPANPDLARTLEKVAAAPDGIAIYLIRQDGVDTWRRARTVTDASGARHGKLPIVGRGLLDLSAFTSP